MIITSNGEDVKQQLLTRLHRGITMMDAKGGYSGEGRKVLITVITRYQLAEVKSLIKEVDAKAFVNILQTTEVIGVFDRGSK